MNIFTTIYNFLFSIHHLAPVGALSLCLWATIQGVKKWVPSVWAKLESAVPEGTNKTIANLALALPAVAMGAAFAASTYPKGVTPEAAFLGTISGFGAVVFQHFVKLVPEVYRGLVKAVASGGLKRVLPPSFVLLSLGCGIIPPKFSDAEKACLAKAEVVADAKLVQCGKRVDGECSTDAIVDEQEKESNKCLGK